jgi:alkanesulfonate monooxygenase SsuD/methylene tetrahydromethanopterin reductase-like flavin-dependent oxidoreductase (luciferase family)
VDVGIANGWLPEEFAAVGVPMSRRGAGFEDHLAAMRACWGPDPVEHSGPRYPIPCALVGPKPFAGRLPVLIGALAPVAIERAARLGDGVILGLRDWDSARDQISAYRDAGGRGRIVLRAGPMLADAQHAEPPTTFTPACVIDDLERAAALGVDEVIWDLNIVGMHPDEQIHEMEQLASRLQS